MAVHLLDANVFVALAWSEHESHLRASEWFKRHAHSGWATCPFTEAAFVRILSNPSFSPKALSTKNAFTVLAKNLKSPHHHFWPDDVGLIDAVSEMLNRLTGHRQITDAYLIGLAQHRGGRLATLDKAIASWAPKGSVEFIG